MTDVSTSCAEVIFRVIVKKQSDSEDDFHRGCRNVVTNNNSPSQGYTNPDDQPTTNTGSPGSQPTTVLLRTAPTRPINQPLTFTHLGSHVFTASLNISNIIIYYTFSHIFKKELQCVYKVTTGSGLTSSKNFKGNKMK